MPGTPSPDSISTKLARIATLARHRPALVLTSLAHHIDVAFLREAYRRTRKDAAVGVDGQTAEGYGANLEENLQALLGRLKAGTYKAPPVRRVHIAKAEAGKTRPIGIPTFEDKIVQRAVAMVLEAIYEQDFLPCSYGFRLDRHLKTGHTSTGQNRPTGSGRRDELGTTACGPPTASCGGWCGRRGGKSPHAFVRRVSPPAAGARL